MAKSGVPAEHRNNLSTTLQLGVLGLHNRPRMARDMAALAFHARKRTVCPGGDDFDNVIMEWLAEEHLQGVEWRAPQFQTNLRALAEAAKVRGAMHTQGWHDMCWHAGVKT